MFKLKKKKTGIETPEFRKPTTPPPPPTSRSNAVKPNPNYVPPASVAKPKPTVCSMKLDDLRDWVKTRAQIGDVAYCHDRMTEHHYIYCYRKPDDNPIWMMMQPEILEEYFKTESKGEDTMMGTINCTYETPCGWCTKWDKKCDKKIGCNNDKPQRGLRANAGLLDDYAGSELDDIRSGKGLSHLYAALDPNKPLPSGIRKEIRG